MRKKEPAVTPEEFQQRMEARGEGANEKVMNIERELAKYKQQMRAAPKGSAAYRTAESKALQCLRRRKLYQRQQEVYVNQSFTVDQVQYAKENLKMAKETRDQMKASKKELMRGLRKTDVGKLEDVAYELEEVLQDTREVQEVLGRPYHMDTEMDDEDLLEELDALEEEMNSGELDELNEEHVPSYLQERTASVSQSTPVRESASAAEAMPSAPMSSRGDRSMARPVFGEPTAPLVSANASTPSGRNANDDELAALRRSMAV